MKSDNRSVSLDLLRGVCVLYIVGFWHLFNYTNAFPQYCNLITSGITWLVLGSFTFLSGFFVGKKNITFNREGVFWFLKKRMLRIYPLYVIALILYLIFDLTDLHTVLKAAVAVSMLFGPVPPTLWYVTMLLIFYLASPLLIISVKKSRIFFVFALFIFFSPLFYTFLKSVDIRLFTYFPAFYLGIITSVKGGQYIKKWSLIILLFYGVIIAAFLIFKQNYLFINWLLSPFFIGAGAYFIFWFFKNKIWVSELFKPMIFLLAYSSYSMYLFHRPVYMLLRKVYFPVTDVAQAGYLVFFCLPCVILVSFCLQKLCDNALRWTGYSLQFSGNRQ